MFVTLLFEPKYSFSQLTESDSLIVYVFLSEECVISQNYTALLNQLSAEFIEKKIEFIGIFPNSWSNDSTINDFKIKYAINFQMKKDSSKLLTKKLGITITPEVAVWSISKNDLIYKGKIDNLYERIGKRRQKATTSELYDVLIKWILNKNISYTETKAVGCFINLKN
jgi:hypothetical protein